MVLTAICRNTPRRKQRWDEFKSEASSKQSITGASYTIYTPATIIWNSEPLVSGSPQRRPEDKGLPETVAPTGLNPGHS